MNVSSLLMSSVAALSVVGAIGFANAQSTTPGTTQPDAQARQLDQNANNTNGVQSGTNQSGSSMNNTLPAAGNSGSTMTDGSLQRSADLPAQADRN